MKNKTLPAALLVFSFSLLLAATPCFTAEKEMLQVSALQGRFLDDQGQELKEYDYLEQGRKYRLMPGAEAEIATLDGLKIYKAKGPGVVELDAAGRPTLNGERLAGKDDRTEVLASKPDSFQGGRLAGLPIRGQIKIDVEAKTSTGATKKLPLYSGYHALVIGVGDYSKGWPILPNPIQDAREVAALLKGLGWEVEQVENPNWETLRNSLNSLITGPGRDEDKAILVWFSGHGHTLMEADGSELGYIVPVDAPDPDRDEMGFMARALSMRQVETVARRIMSKHVLMIFDSCFSGAIFQTTRAIPSPFIEEKMGQPVRQFITAGNEKEQVPDKSYFKTVFLQGVGQGYADRNRDGYITGQELGAYLQEKVVNYSHKAQHPQYGKINNPKLDKGDFIFVKQGAAPGARAQAKDKAGVRTASADPAARPTVVAEKKTTGKVEVSSNVGGVRFRLADVWLETKRGTALVIGQVPTGEHEILARKEGYQDWTGRITVQEDRTVGLDIRMEKAAPKVAEKPAQGKVVVRYQTKTMGYGWSHSQMAMTLTFQGKKVTGVYDDGKGKLVGQVRGREVVGSWSNEKGRKPALYGSEGFFRFNFSEDRKSFEGSMSGGTFEGRWDGFDGRIVEKTPGAPAWAEAKAATPQASPEKVVISYQTKTSGYMVSNSQLDMTLTILGNEVRGVYDDRKGSIVGRLDGREMVGSWINEKGRKPGRYSSEGSLRFTFSEDMKSFDGSFEVNNFKGKWEGSQERIAN